MRVQLNDIEFTFPSSLEEFTLGQRVEFHNQYGRDLEEMAKAVIAMEDGWEKDVEAVTLRFEQMFAAFSFFSGVPVDVLKESEFIDDIAAIYQANMATLFESEEAQELQLQFEFNGEVWEIHPPELKNGSKMTFGEFIDSKQIVKDCMELGQGKWDYLPQLCAIYLRKRGEAYREEFAWPDSDRVKLMHSLPMSIAMQVGFFLSSSMNLYIATSPSSDPQKQKEVVPGVRSITTAGVGSTS